MVKKSTNNPTKRFGSRYGRKVRVRLAKIETEHKRFHKCPYCTHVKVKRVAVGIWECRKCNSVFTGKAYTVASRSLTKPKLEELSLDELPEEVEEEPKEEAVRYAEAKPEVAEKEEDYGEV